MAIVVNQKWPSAAILDFIETQIAPFETPTRSGVGGSNGAICLALTLTGLTLRLTLGVNPKVNPRG